ncbi:hypothetical protein BGW80DRAFT_1435832 [Lactifluus volemus]|nr:hypothetical protein BGW80DRAFT_1435832 [Lactifluus volemus]
MDNVRVDRWATGAAYGPVLSQSDLYLLKPNLQIHPILTKSHSFILIFNILDGYTGGFNEQQTDRDHPFEAANQPATLPRVSTIHVITERSPWCTTVRNESGVTLGIFAANYIENVVTEPELAATQPRIQERIKQVAARNAAHVGGPQWNGFYSSPAPTPLNRLKRVDWLCEAHFFDQLIRDDRYAEQRLGFAAPNVFVMKLETYAN